MVKRTGPTTLQLQNLISDLKTKSRDVKLWNRVVKELPNGEWDIKYVKEKVMHKTHLGVLTVDVQDSKCDDTGTNPISIDYKGQSLTIKNIDNLQFLEYDTDNDGKKELYILTYASCEGFLKIYKVEKE